MCAQPLDFGNNGQKRSGVLEPAWKQPGPGRTTVPGMTNYLYLGLAIICEVIATSFLARSEGFSRLGPTAVSLVGYAISFYLLSLTQRTVPTGVAYAIWSGVGIVLIAAIGWLLMKQPLDLPALLGIGLIVAGVAVIQLFSKTVAH